MSRFPTITEITPQAAIPTIAQCVAVSDQDDRGVVYADAVIAVTVPPTTVTHEIYGILTTNLDAAILLSTQADLQNTTTKGKYVFQIPGRAGTYLQGVGVRQIIGGGAGAVTTEIRYGRE